MKKRIFSACLFFAVFSLLPVPSFALKYIPTEPAECSSVDFRNVFQMKMRNQKELSWCYAHAAADYIQFAYRIDQQISAADIAINYSASNWSKFVTWISNIFSRELRGQPPQTGLIKYAVQMIAPQGYCAEEYLPSDDWTRVDASTGMRVKKEILASILETQELRKNIQSGKIKDASKMPFFYEFKKIDRDLFFNILAKSSANSLLMNLRHGACNGVRQAFSRSSALPLAWTDTSDASRSPASADFSPSFYKLDFQLRTNRVFQNMNSSFDQGMPVTIDFFAAVLKDVDHFKRNLSNLHTVILYGRKYDKAADECVYLLKNSYGEACDRYDPKIACDAGYLWLPESKLFRAMTSQLIFR